MDTSYFDLTGKVAIVTGGNGGIGLAIAQAFARCGADIALLARNSEKLSAANASIEGLGSRCETVSVDVTNYESVAAAIDTVAERFGGIDIVVNNAGINGRVPAPQDITPEIWASVMATNLGGVHFTSILAYPHLVKRGGGKIINISSMLAIFGGKTLAAYAATKGGVDQYTKSCAVAWAKDGIQVNAIQPGWIMTDMTPGMQANPVKRTNIHDRTPAGRFGTPEDLAGTAVFLASRASDFVTGACIPVDGGYASQGTSLTVDI